MLPLTAWCPEASIIKGLGAAVWHVHIHRAVSDTAESMASLPPFSKGHCCVGYVRTYVQSGVQLN